MADESYIDPKVRDLMRDMTQKATEPTKEVGLGKMLKRELEALADGETFVPPEALRNAQKQAEQLRKLYPDQFTE